MVNKMTKIVLTGGHAGTTAYATVEEILKRKRSWELFWIGPKSAVEGKNIATVASQILPQYGVYHHPIIAGRLTKKWTRWSLFSLFKIPIGFIHALILLIKIKPKIILSFGGYAAFPIVVVGWILGIPVIIHAQTVVVGLANRLSAFFARKIAIARAESREFLPKDKVVLTGNPVMASVVEVGAKAEIPKSPTIYITGGSTGAQRINIVVEEILPSLLNGFNIIHQTGELDYDHFLKVRENLSPNLRGKYELKAFFDPREVWKIYKKADILISRAGANTISEILITKRPSILIPIPWSTYDEQSKNALAAQKAGIAIVLPEDKLTPKSLLDAVYNLKDNWSRMIVKADTKLAQLDAAAAKKLADLMEGILQSEG